MTDIAARNKRNRAKGARWQSDLRNGFRNQGFDVERLVLTGAEDEGDLCIRQDGQFVIVEAKAAVFKPAEFVREAIIEAEHYAKHRPAVAREDVTGIAVIKREGLNWRDAYVLTTVREYFRLSD